MNSTMAPRRLWIRISLACLALLLGATLIWLGPAATAWTVRASLAGAADDRAWSHVPAGRPVTAACDVQVLLSSPIARDLRPRLDALAARHGFDATLAESNVRLLVLSGEGMDFGYAVASGFRLSPLLLARVAPRWVSMPFTEGGTQWEAAGDGSTVLVPLEPGIVAWIPVGVDPGRVAASLEAARVDPREPLSLEGAALRAMVDIDDRLREQASQQLPREIRKLVATLRRIDGRITARETLDIEVTLTHVDEAGALATTTLLQQANMAAELVRAGGAFAALLGRDAALLGQVPPLKITTAGSDVVVHASADRAQAEAWLDLAETSLLR
jgi:hypothetical protein